MATREDRSRPNILITGTPGTGKTCTSELISEMTGFKHVNVGTLVWFFFFLVPQSAILEIRRVREMMISPLAVSERFDE